MNWAILAVLAMGSTLFGSMRFSLGILCGGLISVVNFHWLYRDLRAVFANHLAKVKTAVMIRYFIRLAATALVLYWVIAGGHVDVIGLVIGLSVVVLSIVLTTVLVLSKKNCIEEV